MGKKSGPKAPAAPDPVKTAAAQSQMNKETAIANANLNRIDQYTPEGSIKFTQTGVNADGTPKYQSTQEYSPEQQVLYDQQNQIAKQLGGLAQNNISRVEDAQSKPWTTEGMTPLQTNVQGGNIQNSIADAGGIQKNLDYSGLTALPGTNDFSADAQRVNDAVYKQATSRLDPQIQQQQRDLASTLAAKGVSENSEAYRNAMDQFSRQRTDAYNQANYSGIQAGSAEQSRLFGLSLAARQQGQSEVNDQGTFANDAQQQQFGQNATSAGFSNTAQQQEFNQGQQNAVLNNTGRQQQIQEQAFERNLPLNDIAALLGTGGGVQQPQFADYASTNVANTDYSGLVQNNYNAKMQQYNQQQAARSQGLGSIFGLAGSLGAAAISDARLKHNIKRVGDLANGLATYVFSYLGEMTRHFGVMAQEVLNVRPDAVIVLPSGYMAVDYGKVY